MPKLFSKTGKSDSPTQLLSGFGFGFGLAFSLLVIGFFVDGEYALAEAHPEWDEASLTLFLKRIAGDFDNLAQFNNQPILEGATPTFSHLGLQRRRVDAPALGQFVIYAQINRNADPADVYRQSLQVFALTADGKLEAQNYRFTDTTAHIDILATPARFAKLTQDDVQPALPPGCEPRWAREGEIFVSRISRDDCVIRSKRDGSIRRIQATEFVEPLRIRNEESGYTDDYTMIFGVPAGQLYIYDRQTP